MANNTEQKKRVNFLKGFTEDASLMRLFFIMVVAFILMTIITKGKFVTGANISSMATQFPEIGILAIAVSITMLLGGINLSVVGIANLSGVFCCLTIIKLEPSIGTWPAIFVGLMVALVCGLV